MNGWGLPVDAVLVNQVDRNKLSVAADPITADLDFSPVEAGMLMSGFCWTDPLFEILFRMDRPRIWSAMDLGTRRADLVALFRGGRLGRSLRFLGCE